MDVKELANKKLLRIQCIEGTPSVGSTLLVNNKNVGTITSIHPNGQSALAVLRKNAWTTDTLLIGEDFVAKVLAV